MMKRYDLIDDCKTSYMSERSDGDYVEFDDVKELLSKIRESEIKINRYTVNEIKKVTIELEDKTIEVNPERTVKEKDIPEIDFTIYDKIRDFQIALQNLRKVNSLNIYLDFTEN